MTLRGRRIAILPLLTILLLLGAGAVGSAGSYRRQTELDRRLVSAESVIADRNARIVALTRSLAAFQAEVSSARSELTAARRALRTTQALLQAAGDEVRATQEAMQEKNLDLVALRTCLTGAVQALHYMAGADHYRAIHSMVSVDPECKRAQELLGQP